MSKEIINNKKSSDLKSVNVNPEAHEVPFEDLPLHGGRHYKLRAECLDDVLLFIHRMPTDIWCMRIVQREPLPDVEFEFKTTLTLDEIIALLEKQDDSHVMMETLKPFDEYTGDR